jgi:hypothetical protein
VAGNCQTLLYGVMDFRSKCFCRSGFCRTLSSGKRQWQETATRGGGAINVTAVKSTDHGASACLRCYGILFAAKNIHLRTLHVLYLFRRSWSTSSETSTKRTSCLRRVLQCHDLSDLSDLVLSFWMRMTECDIHVRHILKQVRSVRLLSCGKLRRLIS